jgi:hypothetical protein
MNKKEAIEICREMRDSFRKDAKRDVLMCGEIYKSRAAALDVLIADAEQSDKIFAVLDYYADKCERGYCGHAHRDRKPKCHVEGCECTSFDNRAFAAIGETK